MKLNDTVVQQKALSKLQRIVQPAGLSSGKVEQRKMNCEAAGFVIFVCISWKRALSYIDINSEVFLDTCYPAKKLYIFKRRIYFILEREKGAQNLKQTPC